MLTSYFVSAQNAIANNNITNGPLSDSSLVRFGWVRWPMQYRRALHAFLGHTKNTLYQLANVLANVDFDHK